MFNLAQPPKTLTQTKFARETSRSGDAASQRRDGAARYVCLTPSSLESQHRAWRGRPAYALKPRGGSHLVIPVRGRCNYYCNTL